MPENREIKFRSWDGKTITQRALGADVSPAKHEFGMDLPVSYNAFYSTGIMLALMQSTGLHDKNGKEIYEGDVLRTPHFSSGAVTHYMYHTVEWSAKYAGWFVRSTVAKHDSDGCVQLWVYAQNTGDCEVTGNIYENPELLQK